MHITRPTDGIRIEITAGELADLLETYMRERKTDEAYVLVQSALPGIIYALRYVDYLSVSEETIIDG